jgi:hypothetical protein
VLIFVILFRRYARFETLTVHLTALAKATAASAAGSENMLEMRELCGASSSSAHSPTRHSSGSGTRLPVTPIVAQGGLPHRRFDVIASPGARLSGKALEALGGREAGPVQFTVKGMAEATGGRVRFVACRLAHPHILAECKGDLDAALAAEVAPCTAIAPATAHNACRTGAAERE